MEEKVDHAVAWLSSITDLKALKVLTKGAVCNIMDFHRGLGGHAYEDQLHVDTYHQGI